jgi:hypothetical protein
VAGNEQARWPFAQSLWVDGGHSAAVARRPLDDTTSYLAAYADVNAAHVNPLNHFLQFGIHEGRSAFADGVWG